VLQQELVTGIVLTFAADTAAAVKGVTLCHGKQETLFGEDQPSCLFAYARRAVGCIGDGDEIAPTERVRSDYGLLSSMDKSAQHRRIRRVVSTHLPTVVGVFELIAFERAGFDRAGFERVNKAKREVKLPW